MKRLIRKIIQFFRPRKTIKYGQYIHYCSNDAKVTYEFYKNIKGE